MPQQLVISNHNLLYSTQGRKSRGKTHRIYYRRIYYMQDSPYRRWSLLPSRDHPADNSVHPVSGHLYGHLSGHFPGQIMTTYFSQSLKTLFWSPCQHFRIWFRPASGCFWWCTRAHKQTMVIIIFCGRNAAIQFLINNPVSSSESQSGSPGLY